MCCQSTESDCMTQSYFKNPNLLQAKPAVPLRTVDEQVWDMLRANREQLLVSNVIDKVDVSYFKAKALLNSWKKSGHARRYQTINPKTKCPQQAYELLLDCGQEPPQVDGKGLPKSCSGNELIWRTLRILKVCNANQIVASATDVLNIKTVRQYLRQLHMSGYLMMVDAPRGVLATYRLMHDTGPRAPQVKRGKKIYDGNLGIVVYDPETKLPPSHRQEDAVSKQKQVEKIRSKQEKKERRHV